MPEEINGEMYLSERIDRSIARAVKRFSGSVSIPLNIEQPTDIKEVLASSISNEIKEKVVQIGINQDSVLIISPETSHILYEKPKNEAFLLFIDSIKTNYQQKKDAYKQTLILAHQRTRLSLIAASLGFLVVLIGVIAVLLGYSTIAIVTSASGVVSEAVSIFFFREVRHSEYRVDKMLEQLVEAEGYSKAFSIITQYFEGEQRNRLLEAIVRKIMKLDDAE